MNGKWFPKLSPVSHGDEFGEFVWGVAEGDPRHRCFGFWVSRLTPAAKKSLRQVSRVQSDSGLGSF